MNTLVKTTAPIDIQLVSWMRPAMTELVIRAIHRNTPRERYRLLVFDNGSSEEQQGMLAFLQDNGYVDDLFLSPKNQGLETARNEALKMTTSDLMVCVDNDCIPEEGWLDALVELMQKYENHAAIAARTQIMIGTGNIFEQADKSGDDIVDFPHPGGSFRIMRTEAVRRVGAWGDDPGRGSEERRICGRLREAGWSTAFATKVRCLHLFGPKDTTDRWGYDKTWQPEATGHSDIWHPALESGDDINEIEKFVGEELARRYAESNITAER